MLRTSYPTRPPFPSWLEDKENQASLNTPKCNLLFGKIDYSNATANSYKRARPAETNHVFSPQNNLFKPILSDTDVNKMNISRVTNITKPIARRSIAGIDSSKFSR